MSDKLTCQVIAKMLKENTGTHFLDSGGTYGRHWQRNQARTFESESPVALKIGKYGIEYTRNIYHYLVNCLTYEKGLNNSYASFDRKHADDSYYETFEKWIKHKGYSAGPRDNTYNSENCLSQDFVFSLFSLESETRGDIYDYPYVALQIHGGCDIRGGYTAIKIFTWNDGFLFWADGSIGCETNAEHCWQTDDTYHWYYQGSCGRDSGAQLETHELMCLDDILDEIKENPDYIAACENQMIIPDAQLSIWADYKPAVLNPVKLSDFTDIPTDVLWYDDNNAFCPLCSKENVWSKLMPG